MIGVEDVWHSFFIPQNTSAGSERITTRDSRNIDVESGYLAVEKGKHTAANIVVLAESWSLLAPHSHHGR